MKGLILSLLATTSMTPLQPVTSLTAPVRASGSQLAPVSEWSASGRVGQACELQVVGEATDLAGAALDVSCARDASVMGNVLAHLAAHGWRQRRATITAEIKAGDAMSASLWLKTQRGTTTLMFDDDTEQNLLGATRTPDGWERRVITLPIAADATQISFGVLLQGSGTLELRDVRINISDLGAMSPAAAQLLDAAIDIVKHQTLQRDDLAWGVLEPQLRLFASGAQSTADVYPAIKYLLSRLGDKQSLLLTPDVAAALNRVSPALPDQEANAPVNIFALPDGASLVLSRTLAEQALRTAQNQMHPAALP
jgi:hypothetical protein